MGGIGVCGVKFPKNQFFNGESKSMSPVRWRGRGRPTEVVNWKNQWLSWARHGLHIPFPVCLRLPFFSDFLLSDLGIFAYIYINVHLYAYIIKLGSDSKFFCILYVHTNSLEAILCIIFSASVF